ncbi:AbrB family transcriptional regulator [Cereibacter sphaeroides]|uniref:AbrB family transcriptional regulator n=1 Tax=Cereibacter sphaeroides TaxID=1063 RepID=UPI001F20C2F6|nr:AbrB family transcriptional regulator [Cereibacter sphaeroides]MCE6959733.1 AbrB family transcriptional regulator [Cereibacter sphaeroides]MCE6974587.1 AbrB family transcriptional regulator [Cereibacter sphaeroides]
MRLPFDPLALILTFTLGAAGGMVARALGLPLPLLMGSLCAVGAAAALRVRLFGRAVAVPQKLRIVFLPVIGVAIGGAFTTEVVREAPRWWPSLLALFLFIPLAHVIGYQIFRRVGGLPKPTAWFGATPGGLIESVALGEEAGADAQMLVLLQFLRLILTIVLVPAGFTLLTGHAVGSAAGTAVAGLPLGWTDLLVLAVAALAGVWLGGLLRLPAFAMTGPVALSALAHLAGLTRGVPPEWLIGLTQIGIGSVLGARFAGLPRGALPLAGRLAAMNVTAALALAFAFALPVAALSGQPVAAVFLAFAPGGLAEMSLIALSLQMSIVYVTAHHVARIVLSVTVARLVWWRIG